MAKILQNSEKYIQNEQPAIENWLNLHPDIKKHVVHIIDNKTFDISATDYRLILDNHQELMVEVKTEGNIYNKTHNIALDTLSWFQLKKSASLQNICSHSKLMANIEPNFKFGTALFSDADIIIKDIPSANISKAYDNHKLQSLDAKSHFVLNYNEHINSKEKYGIDEDWQSAFLAVTEKDLYLVCAEIDSYQKLIECLKPHCCVCGGIISDDRCASKTRYNKYICHSASCQAEFTSHLRNVVNYPKPQKRT